MMSLARSLGRTSATGALGSNRGCTRMPTRPPPRSNAGPPCAPYGSRASVFSHARPLTNGLPRKPVSFAWVTVSTCDVSPPVTSRPGWPKSRSESPVPACALWSMRTAGTVNPALPSDSPPLRPVTRRTARSDEGSAATSTASKACFGSAPASMFVPIPIVVYA